jgi:hypothetical protein
MISDPAADAALRGLSDALLSLLDQGARPLCADGTGRWIDDSAAVRATVAPVCDDCEIRPRCHDFANTARPRITHGVFGGVDFTTTTRQTRQPTAPTGETS